MSKGDEEELLPCVQIELVNNKQTEAIMPPEGIEYVHWLLDSF